MIELLTEQDKDNIISWITAFGPYNNGTPSSSVPKTPMASFDYLMRHWNTNKAKLWPLFGSENLILRKSYDYSIPVSQRETKLSKQAFSSPSFSRLRQKFSEVVEFTPSLFSIRYDLMTLFSWHTLCINDCKDVCMDVTRGDSDSFAFELPNGKMYKVEKTMRPLKVIRKILETWRKENDWEEDFEDVRIMISQVNNTATLKGELCLSIHPMDYMTMSDNENNWGSCMRWRRSGEYSQGTIEMMNSPCVIVAYLHNPDKPMSLPNNNHWDNKLWRELFYVSDEIITEVKPYPYDDENLTLACLNWICELMQPKCEGEFAYYEFDGSYVFIPPVNEDEEKREFCIEFRNDYMYNDFGSINNRNHYMALNLFNLYNHYPKVATDDAPWISVDYSGPNECMWCGNDIDAGYDYDSDEHMAEMRICATCAGAEICASCGHIINNDDIYVTANGDIICANCYDEYYNVDAITSEIHNNNSMVNIWLASGFTKNDYDEETPEFTGDYIIVSQSTLNNTALLSEFFKIDQPRHYVNPRRYWVNRDYFLLSDCTKHGKRLFDWYDDEEEKEEKSQQVF